MINFYKKNKAKIILGIGILFLLRGIFRLFKGTITIANATPEGFDKDYVMSVWVGKIVVIFIGLVIFIFGLLRFRKLKS